MKKVMFILTTILILSVIMGSALKPREEKTKIQTVINEEMNVAVASEGNNITEANEEFSNTIQTGRYKATKNKKFIDTLQIDKMLASLPEKYEKETVFEADWGHGEGEYAVAGESPPLGPSNVYVEEKGNIYIWDLGNYRIIVYNKYGELINHYETPKKWGGYIRRIFMRNDTLSLEWGGIDLQTKKIVNKPEVKNTDKKQIQVSLDWHQKMYDKTKDIGLKQYSELIEQKKSKIILKERKEKCASANETSAANFLNIDNKGNYYLLSYYWINERYSISYTKNAIYKYSPDNELLAIIDIPEAILNILWGDPRSLNYYIDGNGDIYVLLPKGKIIEERDAIGYDLDLDKVILYKYKLIK